MFSLFKEQIKFTDEKVQLNTVSNLITKAKRSRIITVNQKKIKMLPDSGLAVSVIDKSTFKNFSRETPHKYG